MITQDNRWFEVWYVNGVDYIPAYLVVVTPKPNDPNTIIILDLDKNEILFEGSNYEEAHNWLTEDGFGFVKGRTDSL